MAKLETSAFTTSAYCIEISRRSPASEDLAETELLALPLYKEAPFFWALDHLVFHATGMTHPPVDVRSPLNVALGRPPSWETQRRPGLRWSRLGSHADSS